MNATDATWQEIREAAAQGDGVTYITTEVAGETHHHVVMTRDRLEALVGHDPGHDEEAFPHSHRLIQNS
jgi:hypothetical protein